MNFDPSPIAAKALFAVEDIPPGTLIITEKPLISIPNSDRCRRSDIDWPSDALSPRDQARYLALHDAKLPNCTQLVSIFQSNCVTQDRGAGVCAIVSRINHSCVPNVSFDWDKQREVEEVQSLRKIQNGEELLMSYVGVKRALSKKEREKRLDHYGFKCKCEACREGRDT